ncbi:MAG: hypothetical protein NTW58_02800 [Actinobacteria bacterium]|nr:hypothetical protein [Actinomycetota bacterium]
MERMQSGERSRVREAARDDDRGRIAVDAAMLVFLIGLALLFVANAPS